MIRSLLFCLLSTSAALLAIVAPQKAAAQYGSYPSPPPYAPSQDRLDIRELGGEWNMAGREDQWCQIVPSRGGDRALFINEKGDRAEGYFRGNRIFVPRWGNLQGRYLGDTIRWSNGTAWVR